MAVVWFILPLATAGVSGVFAAAVLLRYLDGRRLHNLLWSAGLLGIMAAAACQLAAEFSGGWNEPVYRLYYWAAGIGPAMLGAGTMYLLSYRKVADIFLWAVLGLAAAHGVACAVLPIDTTLFVPGQVESGVKAAALPMRILIAILNTAGTVALVGGALLSFRATRYIHNLHIAAGAAVFAAGGTIAGLFPEQGGLSTIALLVGNLTGIILLFVGFWLARTARPEPVASAVAAAVVAPRP